jgi:hypothetical protein
MKRTSTLLLGLVILFSNSTEYYLAPVTLSADLRTAGDFARAFVPTIRDFLTAVAQQL